MKIRPVVTDLFHSDGRTDMQLIVALRNFAKTLKKGAQLLSSYLLTRNALIFLKSTWKMKYKRI